MKFKIKKVNIAKRMRKEWRWTLYGRNGKVIATSGSETYHNRQDCLDTISLIKGSVNRAEVVIIDGIIEVPYNPKGL